jgi:hypothetical protein
MSLIPLPLQSSLCGCDVDPILHFYTGMLPEDVALNIDLDQILILFSEKMVSATLNIICSSSRKHTLHGQTLSW